MALGTNPWKHLGYDISTIFLSLHGSSRFEGPIREQQRPGAPQGKVSWEPNATVRWVGAVAPLTRSQGAER